MSSACLANHWLCSPPLGGMRTIGVTAGASEPPVTSCRRLSMYCMASRSWRGSQKLCSISKTTPSNFDWLSATAGSISAGEKHVKAVWPLSKALMTWLRRGSSAMAFSSKRLVARDGLRGATPYCEFCPTQPAFSRAISPRGAPRARLIKLEPALFFRFGSSARQHDHRLSRPLHDRAAEAARLAQEPGRRHQGPVAEAVAREPQDQRRRDPRERRGRPAQNPARTRHQLHHLLAARIRHGASYRRCRHQPRMVADQQ